MLTAIGVSGLAELSPRLVLLNAVIREAAVIGLDAGAQLIEDEWKRNVKEKAYKTGRYHDSITHKRPTPTPGGAATEIYADIDPKPGQPYGYPVYVEFGTRFMTARPCATPALDAKRDEAVASVETAVATAVVKYFPPSWSNLRQSFLAKTQIKSYGGSML